ncbi:hypothetical protein O6B72_01980 [Campylobacter ureolyticus]|uniref:hypothetical protein n=1 Tax=Campylobacter ureolyticus TaxID=827 RepID=UPI0022B43C7E|nr:hypothetical protein [Campylobacter ureolyticus]MCZ6155591.1 hypothetical protein [Campylobacter ureolyticus]
METKRKACFYFGSPSESNWRKAQGHNLRIAYVPHLLPDEFSLFNEYWGDSSAKLAQEVFNSKFALYCEGKKGKKPIIANNIREAIVNCDSHTTIEQLIELADAVNSEFGYYPLSISIHRDEGVLKRKSDGKIFIPQVDFEVDENGEAWELSDGGYENGKLKKAKKTGKKFFDVYSIDEFEPVRNYHAHMTFCTLRDPSKWRRSGYSMGTSDLKKLQSMTAEILGMERGVSGAKRLDWRSYKAKKYLENEAKEVKADIQNMEYSTLAKSREMFQTTVGATFDNYENQVKSDEETLKMVQDSRKFFENMANSGDMTYEFYRHFQNNFYDFEEKLKEKIKQNNLYKGM